MDALQAIPRTNAYFFLIGASEMKTVVSHYQGELKTIFERAGVLRGYPHLFRHTFATWLLEDGVPIEDVAKLMGHTTEAMTRLYSHWIKSRQEGLEAKLKNSWSRLVRQKPSAPPKQTQTI